MMDESGMITIKWGSTIDQTQSQAFFDQRYSINIPKLDCSVFDLDEKI
jgi:hypothetical protein